MSVLPIFGENLQHLCRIAGSTTSVAREIGVNRVQFNRFLKSEAFPKPHILQKVCDRFGVDARILTERLTERQLALLESGKTLTDTLTASPEGLEAMGFLAPDQAVFDVGDDVPDGLYELYRMSPTFKDKANLHLIQIKTLNLCKVARGYQSVSIARKLGLSTAYQDREYRGVLLRQPEGFCFIQMQSPPDNVISMYFFSPYMGLDAFVGHSMINVGPRRFGKRVSPLYIRRLEPTAGNVLAFARRRNMVDIEDVPAIIRDVITAPIA